MFSALIYFDGKQALTTQEEKYTLRDLQNHFIGEEDPLSFLDYAKKIGFIYRELYKQLST